MEEETILQRVLCNRHLLHVLFSPSEFPVSSSEVLPAAECVLHFQPLMALAAAAHEEQAAVLLRSGRRRHGMSAWPKLLGCWHDFGNCKWLLSGKQPILHPCRKAGSNYLLSGHSSVLCCGQMTGPLSWMNPVFWLWRCTLSLSLKRQDGNIIDARAGLQVTYLVMLLYMQIYIKNTSCCFILTENMRRTSILKHATYICLYRHTPTLTVKKGIANPRLHLLFIFFFLSTSNQHSSCLKLQRFKLVNLVMKHKRMEQPCHFTPLLARNRSLCCFWFSKGRVSEVIAILIPDTCIIDSSTLA